MRALHYLAPHFFALLVSGVVATVAWRRRETPGARAFALSALSQSFWTAADVAELASGSLAKKEFWDDLQFLATACWALAFYAFAERYSGGRFRLPHWPWLCHFAVSVIFFGLVATDRWHGLIRPESRIVYGEPFDTLVYPFTTVVRIGLVYMIGTITAAILLLTRDYAGTPPAYRSQRRLIVAGALIPLAGMTLTVVGLSRGTDRTLIPQSFAAGDLLIVWGLFRYRLLDLVPIARGAVVEGMGDPVIVLDKRERLVDLNPAAERVFGRPLRELLGRPSTELSGAWPELGRDLASGPVGYPVGYKEIGAQIDGERRLFEVRIAPLSASHGARVGRVIVAHDITRLKAVEHELAEHGRELEEANRELDAFTHSVSHDLRAPLRAIDGFARILVDEHAGGLDERGRRRLAQVQLAAQRMRRLMDDLLRFSRFAHHSIARRSIDTGALVRSILEELGSDPERCRATVVVKPLPPCNADPSLIRQVFENLIGNAFKYSRVRSTPFVEIGARQERGKTTYYVRDNGVGFDPRNAERLFGVFQRLHSADEFEGSGVGLAIVAKVVARHGGRVWVEAELDRGATFFFTLGDDSGAAEASIGDGDDGRLIP